MRTDYNRVRMTRIFGTAHGAVEIIKGLKLKEVLSYDYSIQKDARYFNALSGRVPRAVAMPNRPKVLSNTGN